MQFTAAKHCNAQRVYLSDMNSVSLANAVDNVALNDLNLITQTPEESLSGGSFTCRILIVTVSNAIYNS